MLVINPFIFSWSMSKGHKNRYISRYADRMDDNLSDEFSNLYSMEEDSLKVSEGQVIQGRVVSIEKGIVVVDVGLKNEGVIPIEEFKLDTNAQIPQIGEVVEVYVDKIEGTHGKTVLSRAKAIRDKAWKELEIAYANNEFVEGVVFARIKGGLAVDLSGVVAFLPGSQIDVRPVDKETVDSQMGLVQLFKILKICKHTGNVVVSKKAVLEEQRHGAKQDMLAKISEGTVLRGLVKNITNYGAFIDLGALDALLHIADMCWRRISHPLELLKIGEEIDVVVIKFDRDTQRLHVGTKQLDLEPWNRVLAKFPVGTMGKGKISSVTDYGAFVDLDGIEGLIHVSEMSWVKNIPNPSKIVQVGQEIDFCVKSIDHERHKISLSMKMCTENPWQKFADANPAGTVIQATISNVTNFGIFVGLGKEIDGLIHETDIADDGAGVEMLKKYKKGDVITCKVLSPDIEKERIALGIKQLTEADVVANIIPPRNE